MICTGEEEGREAIMQAGLPAMLPRLLSVGEEEARLAAVWCVINLTNNGPDYPDSPNRVAALREAGVSAVRNFSPLYLFHAALLEVEDSCISICNASNATAALPRRDINADDRSERLAERRV